MSGIRCSLFPLRSHEISTTGFILLLLIFISPNVDAQAIWVEGGGGTPSYAVQYEHPLVGTDRGEGFYGRIGLGLERTRISAPLSVHWISGGNPHHLVFMAGATPQIRNLDTKRQRYLSLPCVRCRISVPKQTNPMDAFCNGPSNAYNRSLSGKSN